MRTRDRRIPDGRIGIAALIDAVAPYAAALAIGYAAVALLVWGIQERLIFIGAAPTGAARPPDGSHIQDVEFRTRDGTLLRGVMVVPATALSPLVIYYGGNAEEVTQRAPDAARLYGRAAVLLMNYRGYGRSEGRASEAALVSDALELRDWAARQPGIDASRIVLHGRSLGTGVAVAVAAARPPRGVVLTSPFASARAIAMETYPWLPVRWLLRHPFDSSALAPRIEAPLLVVIGAADDIIAPRHSETLAAAWAGRVERRTFTGFGHNDLDLHPEYAQAIRSFVERCLAGA